MSYNKILFMIKIYLGNYKEIIATYSRETIVVVVFIIFLIINKVLDIILKKISHSKLKNIPEEKTGKIKTIFNLFKGVKSIIVWVVALLIVLSLYNVKLTPILTGFGIIGVIIGLASQTIVVDIISGIAIILDGFFYIGDRVKIGDIEGEIIDINLRRTYIKDDQGYVHSIPNSQIKLISKKE
jgi:small-conductance mechanosensitive channel